VLALGQRFNIGQYSMSGASWARSARENRQRQQPFCGGHYVHRPARVHSRRLGAVRLGDPGMLCALLNNARWQRREGCEPDLAAGSPRSPGYRV
jgi:hypothetical protein